jgi:hypothetical protein
MAADRLSPASFLLPFDALAFLNTWSRVSGRVHDDFWLDRRLLIVIARERACEEIT